MATKAAAWRGAMAPRLALLLALAALVLLALAAAGWRGVQRSAPAPSRSSAAAALKDLPARPEDIEAHGEQSLSVLPPDDARARNAAVAFWGGPVTAAKPFVFRGSADDRTRALQCLATAVLYEAGDDAVGEAAVAQVILNRVRHLAFPGTICGVVYQGSERSTGCQFTFTCDGSLRRQMPEAAWRRARAVAERALSGKVDRSVGLATHYHTDWVYPYWSPSLNKLARVGTHLFFGWPGGWGSLAAFKRAYAGKETGPAAAADLSIAPSSSPVAATPQAPVELPGIGKVPLYGLELRLMRPDGRGFVLFAPPGATPSRLVNAALALCTRPGPCEVVAWDRESDMPGAYPIQARSRGNMVFEYAEGGTGTASIRFDCDRFPNRNPKVCLRPAAAPPPVSRSSPKAVPPPELSGVRFKN